MTKIDIFSGFLGAGKTTLIKKLIKESFAGQKVVLIENEFGEIGIDGGFLKESGIQINELNAGCICCSLVGDFRAALQQVVEQYHPDRIVIVLEDHGPGIPPEELPHLFDRYYRARQDAGKTGTGLGLSITKAILQQHDFPFGVNSTVGKGSTFWFEMKAPQ